jgi:hypothetical protein
MKPPRYTAAQVADALRQTKGLVTLAAKRLGCSDETVQNYCRKFASVQAAKASARTELLDLAELKLWLAVQRGDAWAVTFCLKTIGKERGYGETLSLHVEIERVAARVAQDTGLDAAAILAEAQRLLEEYDRDVP